MNEARRNRDAAILKKSLSVLLLMAIRDDLRDRSHVGEFRARSAIKVGIIPIEFVVLDGGSPVESGNFDGF